MLINKTFTAAVINQAEGFRDPMGFSVAIENTRCPVHLLISIPACFIFDLKVKFSL
jgi:hypothetical protein